MKNIFLCSYNRAGSVFRKKLYKIFWPQFPFKVKIVSNVFVRFSEGSSWPLTQNNADFIIYIDKRIFNQAITAGSRTVARPDTFPRTYPQQTIPRRTETWRTFPNPDSSPTRQIGHRLNYWWCNHVGNAEQVIPDYFDKLYCELRATVRSGYCPDTITTSNSRFVFHLLTDEFWYKFAAFLPHSSISLRWTFHVLFQLLHIAGISWFLLLWEFTCVTRISKNSVCHPKTFCVYV